MRADGGIYAVQRRAVELYHGDRWGNRPSFQVIGRLLFITKREARKLVHRGLMAEREAKERKERARILSAELRCFRPATRSRAREALAMRWRSSEQPQPTYREIAERLGVSGGRAWQIVSAAARNFVDHEVDVLNHMNIVLGSERQQSAPQWSVGPYR